MTGRHLLFQAERRLDVPKRLGQEKLLPQRKASSTRAFLSEEVASDCVNGPQAESSVKLARLVVPRLICEQP